jgi:hypothetical protein
MPSLTYKPHFVTPVVSFICKKCEIDANNSSAIEVLYFYDAFFEQKKEC